MSIQINQFNIPGLSFGLSVERLLTQGPNGLVVRIDYLAELFAEPLNITGKHSFSWRPRIENLTVDPEIPYAELTEAVCVEWLSNYGKPTMQRAVRKSSEDFWRQRAEAEPDKDKPKQTPLPWS